MRELAIVETKCTYPIR